VTTVVVPFRARGKSRLPAEIRVELALAMLGDVLEAAVAHADHVRLVTGDEAASVIAADLGVEVVADPGGGQGAAVRAALAGLEGPCLVVNADLPCATAAALGHLAGLGSACVPAPDGTTNALSLTDPASFAPQYGPDSAARFAADGLGPVSIPELERDVDTILDLERLALQVGRRTSFVSDRHGVVVAPTA